jgi:hypothetical protein
VAAAIAGFVILAPLALALIGQDYFLSRNEIPAFVPVAIVLAAACTAPRTRPVGAALAVGLIAMFSFAALYVQTHRFLQRPDWRGVARTLGPAVVPRAILAADGLTADPLKIYLPGVSWVQQRNRPTLIREIDVVGATKRLAVAPERRPVLAASSGPPVLLARPVPRTVAPPGTVLLARFRFRNWVVARFALRRPRRVTLDELAALAPQLFRHAPAALLVFTQPRETRG